MKRFIVAPEAAQDLDAVWSYIAEDSLDAADRFLEKLYKNIRMLAETPGMGHAREDLVGQRRLLFWPAGD
jgi:toxin ParE1/3/4